jgi:hypothetical protein
MRIRLLIWAVVLVALPVASDEISPRIDILYGHPVYRQHAREAGVAMGMTISVNEVQAALLTGPCERLRAAASLAREAGGGLPLQTLFVVPSKGMAIEGYYFPSDGNPGRAVLIPGRPVTRSALDRIMALAAIPPALLDEISVSVEISCRITEPLWVISWHDIRRIGDAQPEAVVEVARRRFKAIYRSVVEYGAKNRALTRRIGRSRDD